MLLPNSIQHFWNEWSSIGAKLVETVSIVLAIRKKTKAYPIARYPDQDSLHSTRFTTRKKEYYLSIESALLYNDVESIHRAIKA